jgi:molecular chaperone GrpE (heat shock protein)
MEDDIEEKLEELKELEKEATKQLEELKKAGVPKDVEKIIQQIDSIIERVKAVPTTRQRIAKGLIDLTPIMLSFVIVFGTLFIIDWLTRC